jgi:deazaflavin-dependent oxidoreductase (nitroreductase family)
VDYAPSPVDWVREEVDFIERTGASGLRGRSVIVLSTVGVRSGLLRKTPLMRVEHRGSYAAVASAAGAAQHPAWYGNALAHPEVEVRDGPHVHALVARELTGDERSRWWSRACGTFPSYAAYASATARQIPVLLLEP